MAVATTLQPTNYNPNSWSVGPYKQEVYSWTAITGDTSVVVTAQTLNNVAMAILTGATQGAAPTISGKVATFTVPNDGDKFGQIILLGM